MKSPSFEITKSLIHSATCSICSTQILFSSVAHSFVPTSHAGHRAPTSLRLSNQHASHVHRMQRLLKVHRCRFVIIGASPPQPSNYQRRTITSPNDAALIPRGVPTEAPIIESKSKSEHLDNDVSLSRPENRLNWRVIRTT